MASWSSLSEAQRGAALHEDGPAACHAGPGSGKTRVVTLRAARLAERGARVLVTTFTTDATREMEARVKQLTPKQIPGSVHATTIHALCLAILRGQGVKFNLLTEEAQRRGLAEAANAIELEDGAGGFLSRMGYLKNTGETVQTYKPDSSHEDREFARVWRAYEKAKAERGLKEFDDLLLEARGLMADEAVRAVWAAKYSHVIVDECQDMNRPQYQVVLALGRDHQNVMLVGDPDQSLYAFRGADLDTFRTFAKHPATRVYELRENYRSTRAIVAFADSLIRQDESRRPVRFFSSRDQGAPVRWLRCADAEEEAGGVAAEVMRLNAAGTRFGDMAVLFRLNAQAEAFERLFAEAGIPYQTSAEGDFYARREVAGLLAYLEFFSSHADEWLLGLLNVPNRRLGRDAVSALRTTAEFRGKPIWEILPEFHAPDLKTHRAVRQLQRELEHVESRLPGLENAGEAIRLVRRTTDLDAWLRVEEMDDRDNDRLQNVQRMEEAAGHYRRVEDYLAAVRKVREEAARRRAERRRKRGEIDAVTLATGHGAKGLEWRVVFAAGWTEELLPHRKAEDIAEERRIAYVMATRAKDVLTITTIDRWNGQTLDPSRFLKGLTLSSEAPPPPPETKAAAEPDLGGLFIG